MTLNRRGFLGALPIASLALASSRAQAQAQGDGGGRNGQQRGQDDARTPGRALSEDGAASLFAMTSEQE